MNYMCMSCMNQVEILQEAGGYFWIVREFDPENGRETFNDLVNSNDWSDANMEKIIASGCCGGCFELAKDIATLIEPFPAPPEKQIDIAEVRRLIDDLGLQGVPTVRTDFQFKDKFLVDAIARANRSGAEWIAGNDHSQLVYYSMLKIQHGFDEVPFGVMAAAALIAGILSWGVDVVELRIDELTLFRQGREEIPIVGNPRHFEAFFVVVANYLRNLWLS
jgi:hypothetical protein